MPFKPAVKEVGFVKGSMFGPKGTGKTTLMAMILIHLSKTYHNSAPVAWLASEKGVDFEFRHIDRDNRPDWFLAISPHKKVPVLSIDGKVSLFESNAIAEYLDETITPRLHPEDPVQRAINSAWTDYLPTFSEMVTGQAYSEDEAEYKDDIAKIPQAFEKLKGALKAQSPQGPFFNGAKYSLVDAGYAPFLQRYYYLDRIKPLGMIEKFPRVKAWAETLLKR